MLHRFVQSIAMSLLISLGLTAVANEAFLDRELVDPAFVFDVVDPGFCEMPPGEVSDGQLVAMADDPEFYVPIVGELSGPVAGPVYGSGYFKAFSDGIVASFVMFVAVSDAEVMGLCLVVLPVGETDLVEGTANLVGPLPESFEDEAYLAVVQLGERDGSELLPVGEMVGGEGSITLRMPHEETLEGSLSIDGRVEGLSVEGENDFLLRFDFEDMIRNPLTMMRLEVY